MNKSKPASLSYPNKHQDNFRLVLSKTFENIGLSSTSDKNN
jgi:hypothetical protein